MATDNYNLKVYNLKKWVCLQVSGDDSDSFIQSQFTNNIHYDYFPSESYGMWLNLKGKIIADSKILRIGKNNSFIFSENSTEADILEHLNKHIIADDVKIEKTEVYSCLLIDEKYREGLIESIKSNQYNFSKKGVGFLRYDKSIELLYFRSISLNKEFFTFVFFQKNLYEAAVEYLNKNSFNWINNNDFHVLRLKNLMPLIPEEIGNQDMPAESNLVPIAISFTKGCFLGQEVVARLHNLGKPQRKLFILTLYEKESFDEFNFPFIFEHEGKKIGEIRAIYKDKNRKNFHFAVAIIKLRYLNSLREDYHSDLFGIESVEDF